MKRIKGLAIAVSLLPLYGCASLPSFSELNPLDGLFRPEPRTPAAPIKSGGLSSGETRQTPAVSKDVDGAVLEAQNARKSGDLNKATHILSQLVLVAPDDARVLTEYGKALAGLGRSDDAVAFLERAAQLVPTDWSLYSALGVAFDQKGNYQAAQSFYDRALALKPGDPSILNNAALSHMQAGDLDGAENLLHQVARDTPDYPRIAQNLALVEKLRAAQPAKPTAAATSVPAPEAAPVQIISAAQPTPAPAAITRVDAPVIEPEPALPAQLAAVVPPKQPVATAALETPVSAQPVAKGPTPLERLKADPTVQMQAVPKDQFAEISQKQPAKPVVAAVVSATKPAPAPSLDAAPAAKTAAQTRIAANGTYYVQAGAYNTPDRAGQGVAGLEPLGARVMPGTFQGRPIFRVRIGPFRSAAQAKAAIEQAQALGRKDVLIVKEFDGA